MNTRKCPKSDVTLCRCRANPFELMHSADASYYPKAGCFRVNNILFNARHMDGRVGKHLWEVFIHNPIGFSKRYVYSWPGHRVYYASLCIIDGTGVSIPIEPTISGIAPSVHIRRIQRAMRCFLRRGFEERALALMMGLHRRLGAGGCLSEMPADVLCKVLGCAYSI